jgi:hypothetical protein
LLVFAVTPSHKILAMNRRRFAFWVGMGLFGLGEKLRSEGLDQLAALTMQAATPAKPTGKAEHWSVGQDSVWRWFERENYRDGKWKLTGITTPINQQTGLPYADQTGYLSNDLVPLELRLGKQLPRPDHALKGGPVAEAEPDQGGAGKPSPSRRARHGRPPSKWLRSLNAEELRIWLKTIEVSEAGVSGMTFWDHLTRDHAFDPEKIEGLDEAELAKLHAAAHAGY